MTEATAEIVVIIIISKEKETVHCQVNSQREFRDFFPLMLTMCFARTNRVFEF